MKVRRIKQNLWARRFVSNGHYPDIDPRSEQEWRAAVGSKFVPAIHGLAFNDARSQGRRRNVPHGRRALRFLPIDDLHQDRRSQKKVHHASRMVERRQVRLWKQFKHDLTAMTPTAQRFYDANKQLFKKTLARQKQARKANKQAKFVAYGKRVRPEFV